MVKILKGEDIEKVLKILEYSLSSDLEEILSKIEFYLPSELLIDIREALKGLLYKEEFVKKGKFLVVSGLDKTGKETLCFNPLNLKDIKSLKEFFEEKGYNILTINLPSYNTNLGSLISSYLGKGEGKYKILGNISKDYAWILWSLDRAQHNIKAIEWLKKDKALVLAKRWLESNLAYQRANGIEPKRILKFEENIVKQDYTIILDLKPELVLKRTSHPDLYENLEYLKEVRRAYLDLPKYYPYGKFFYLDSSLSLKELNREMLELVEKQIN